MIKKEILDRLASISEEERAILDGAAGVDKSIYMSRDRKVIEIVQKGCLTRITANPDGTLKIENVPLPNAA